jgi:hypothetical protein
VLQWMADLGLDRMDFSLDSKVIVDDFNDNNDFGSIFFCHCKHLFRDSFNNSTLEFSQRQANGILIEPNRKCTAYRSNSSKKSIVPLGSCEFN